MMMRCVQSVHTLTYDSMHKRASLFSWSGLDGPFCDIRFVCFRLSFVAMEDVLCNVQTVLYQNWMCLQKATAAIFMCPGLTADLGEMARDGDLSILSR